MQTKKQSFIEALFNTILAFAVSWGSSLFIYPLFGFDVSYSDAFWIIGIFTIISLIRVYVIRRLFNWLHYIRGKSGDENKSENCSHDVELIYCPECGGY